LGGPTKILITGGGGFIGSHLVDRCLAEGHDVRVLDNFASGRRENLLHVLDQIELVEGDIQSYERVHNAVRGCEVVLHQAVLPSVPRSVQDPLTSNASNVIGTLNVLLAARDSDVGRVVFASSSSVYGPSPVLPKHEDLRPEPISPYAVAKLAGEGYCRSFHEVYGLETVALRYFNVFGPRQDPLSQYAAVIPNFTTALLQGQQPTIFGDGQQSRDFTYVENVVEANLLAMSAADVAGRRFNIACGESITLMDVIDALRQIIGTDVSPRHEPARVGDVRASQADIGAARDVLGFEPAVSFLDGLKKTADQLSDRARDLSFAEASSPDDG
jgi:nucleoside-diphosphate-sugar epimerase